MLMCMTKNILTVLTVGTSMVLSASHRSLPEELWTRMACLCRPKCTSNLSATPDAHDY